MLAIFYLLVVSCQQHQIHVKYCRFEKSFERLRSFVGYYHSMYCPETLAMLPIINVYNKSLLTRRERDEAEIWEKVRLLDDPHKDGVDLNGVEYEEKYGCSIRASSNSTLLPAKLVYNQTADNNVKLKHLVIGVPTTSKRIPFVQEQPIISILLPSLNKTITGAEWQQWTVTVMIVFDEGDYFFDSLYYKEIITRMLCSYGHFNVLLYKQKHRNRILHYWNWMYERAMADKSVTHFYQLNDDFFLHQPGWLTAFSESLNHSMIAFPKDTKKFNCTLPCQIFLDRRHYERFGFLFPPEIKDWHGDTFMGMLYQGRSFCEDGFSGYNGRPGKGHYRYFPCRHVQVRRLVEHYK